MGRLFSGAIPQSKSHVINLNGARRHRCLVQSEIVVTRPPPILRPLHQPLLDGIHAHLFDSLSEFLFVAHKAIPILMLPPRPAGGSLGVQPQRHNFLGVVQHLVDPQRIRRLNQGGPVVRHQNSAAEQKSPPQP
jgi:hypothetical protein